MCASLRKGSSADAKTAFRLGRQAAALGLETLDVARVHEQVLRGTTASTHVTSTRARHFFTEALVPIERTHRAALDAEVRVKELTHALQQRQRETAACKRKLERGVARRESAEAASRAVGLDQTRLLTESRKRQQRLRYRLRKLVVMQEADREKHGLHLRNQIAQTLLALDIRLLSLKEAGTAGMRKLSKEIAETQGLVRRSGKTLTRLAHDRKKQK